MNKKRSALFILSILLILMAGCETVKGAFEGAKKDWQTALKADEWIRENLW
jgi:predicted small secreted protein